MMAKVSAKVPPPVDVLVIGDHPCARLGAMLLAEHSNLRIVHATGVDEPPDDPLVTLNPALSELHPMLAGLKQKINITGLYGLQFLSDDASIASEYRVKSVVAYVARYNDIRDHFAKIFQGKKIESLAGGPSHILGIDENGLEISVGEHKLNARALVLADDSIGDEKKLLGKPESWGADVLHRFTRVRCKSGGHLNLSAKSLMPMSLDLRGELCWGWLLPGDAEFQLIVEQPVVKATANSGHELLAHWVSVLQKHSILGPNFELPSTAIYTFDRPLAGALAHEGVANRTLLIGPAGGFFSACGEELYPACWSAVFAAEVLKKALKETHLQDALNPYRYKWRTTLGDYLRGPHQNLRFLLPLVYRNPAMAARIAEAILLSKSLVR